MSIDDNNSEIAERIRRWLARLWYALSGAEAARVRYWAERALDERWVPSTDPNSVGLFYPRPPTLEESREAFARLKALQAGARAAGTGVASFATAFSGASGRPTLKLERGLEAVHDPETGEVAVRRKRRERKAGAGTSKASARRKKGA